MIFDFARLSLDAAWQKIIASAQRRRSSLRISNRQELPTLETSGNLPIPPDELATWERTEMERKGHRRQILFG